MGNAQCCSSAQHHGQYAVHQAMRRAGAAGCCRWHTAPAVQGTKQQVVRCCWWCRAQHRRCTGLAAGSAECGQCRVLLAVHEAGDEPCCSQGMLEEAQGTVGPAQGRQHRVVQAGWVQAAPGAAGGAQGVTQKAAARAGGLLLKAKLLHRHTAQPDSQRVHVLSPSCTPFASSIAEEHPPPLSLT